MNAEDDGKVDDILENEDEEDASMTSNYASAAASMADLPISSLGYATNKEIPLLCLNSLYRVSTR
jgi:hypothetical protein